DGSEAPEKSGGLVDGGLEALEVGDVRGHADGPPTQLLAELVEPFLPPGEHGDRGAAPDERAARLGADAARRAGDEHPSTGEVDVHGHGLTLLCREGGTKIRVETWPSRQSRWTRWASLRR